WRSVTAASRGGRSPREESALAILLPFVPLLQQGAHHVRIDVRAGVAGGRAVAREEGVGALRSLVVTLVVVALLAADAGDYCDALRVGGPRHGARRQDDRLRGLGQRAVAADRQDVELVALLKGAVGAGVLADGVHEAAGGVHGDLEDYGLARPGRGTGRGLRAAHEEFLEQDGVQRVG